MKKDKEHLNVDLGFLDEAKPPEVKTKAASAYKVNWRSIATIGVLAIAIVGWIYLSDNSSPSKPTPNTYSPPVVNDAGTVKNGQYNCSREDSRQVDLMLPTNELQISQEEKELKQRDEALDALKQRIDMSSVTQYSDQATIDLYNTMVSQYNAQLTAFQTDYAAHQARIDAYNRRVQERNNYLVAHCWRSQ